VAGLTRRSSIGAAHALIALLCGCAAAGGVPSGGVLPAGRIAQDTTALIPAGFGSLRQEDIAISVSSSGLTVRAIPLDESFIRTLSPDSYRSLHALSASRKGRTDSMAMRAGIPTVDVWYITFFNVQQGEARFSPQEVVLTNQGRDFRPMDILPITPGFGDQRLQQRQQAAALYVFDGAIDPNQRLTLTIGSQTGGDWQSVLQKVELERSLIRSRAGGG